MAISKHVIPAANGRKELTIYGETPNINFFLKTPLVPATSAAATVGQATVKAHTRRQYPGDTSAINVSASAREYLKDPSRKSGNGLPGRSILLVADPGLPGEEKRQFTLKGRWVDFHAFLVGQAKMQIKAYNNTGAYSTVSAAAP